MVTIFYYLAVAGIKSKARDGERWTPSGKRRKRPVVLVWKSAGNRIAPQIRLGFA